MRDILAEMAERRLLKSARRIVELVREFDRLKNDVEAKESTEDQVVNALEEMLNIAEEINKL